MSVKLLTEHHLEFLSLKGGYTCSYKSTLVKIPHCWKSHVAAQAQLPRLASILQFLHTTSVSVMVSRERITKELTRLCGCAVWSVRLCCSLYNKIEFSRDEGPHRIVG